MFALGIDVGTSALRAAVSRDGQVSPVRLSEAGFELPSAVLVATDGMVMVGEAAVRRRLIYPELYVEDLARFVRDRTPLVVDGTVYDATELFGELLRYVVTQVLVGLDDPAGESLTGICVCHPAHWSGDQVNRFATAVAAAGLPAPVMLRTGPTAAAEQARHDHHLPVGSVLAVHDLGAGSVDVAVLQRTADGFLARGVAKGSGVVGGNAMDAALAARLSRRGVAVPTVAVPTAAVPTAADPAAAAGAAHARSELERACGRAREALDGAPRVFVPGHDVELTRDDVEVVVSPVVEASAGALLRVLSAAGVARDKVALVSVGGCAAMPAVARALRSRTGLVALSSPHGTQTVAMGAARLAAATGSDSSEAPFATEVTTEPVVAFPGARARIRRAPRKAVVALAVAVAVAGVVMTVATTLRGRPAAAGQVDVQAPGAGGLSVPAATEGAPTDAASVPGLVGSTPSPALELSTPSGSPASATASGGTAIGRCPTGKDALRWACLQRARAVGRTLEISYTLNFSPVDRDEAGFFHVHFFTANPDMVQGTFVTSPRDTSMQQVAAPNWGTWYNVYATGLTVLDTTAEPGGLKRPLDPSGFSLLCVRVAEGGHILAKDLHGGLFTGNCVAISR